MINKYEFNKQNKLSFTKQTKFNLKYNIYDYSSIDDINIIIDFLLLKNNNLINKYNKLLNKIKSIHLDINSKLNTNLICFNDFNFELKVKNNRYKFCKSIYKENKKIKKLNIYLKEILLKYNKEYDKMLNKLEKNNLVKECNDL